MSEDVDLRPPLTPALHDHLRALSATAAYQARFRYRDAPRSGASAADIGVGELGHLLDTLKDAVLFTRNLAFDPSLDPLSDQVYEYVDRTGVPVYVERYASHFLRGSSFHRTDTGGRSEGKTFPDASAFMNLLHGEMRKLSLDIGGLFRMPPEAQAIADQYDAAIGRYKALLVRYPHPVTGEPDFSQIPPGEMHAFAEQFHPVADALEAVLKSLPEAVLRIDGQDYPIPNREPLNDRLPMTYPAAVLFTYRSLGRGAADNNKRPARLEYEVRQRELVGAQSMITDTLQRLYEHCAGHGCPLRSACDLDRAALRERIARYRRTFQLLRTFCRTADCGYDAMYRDLEQWVRMGGGAPPLQRLETPDEVALMLYAVERRLARRRAEPELRPNLRRYADAIHFCKDVQEVRQRFQQQPGPGAALVRDLTANSVDFAG
jgi:hypothetical protein